MKTIIKFLIWTPKNIVKNLHIDTINKLKIMDKMLIFLYYQMILLLYV